jgi:hypothetical protein
MVVATIHGPPLIRDVTFGHNTVDASTVGFDSDRTTRRSVEATKELTQEAPQAPPEGTEA